MRARFFDSKAVAGWIVCLAIAAITSLPAVAHDPTAVGHDSTAVDTDYFDDPDNVDDLDAIDDAGASEIARESSNPLGRLWLLNNQFDNRFREGDITNKTRHTHTWTFQPVIPMPLKGNWIMVSRPIITTVLDTDVPVGPNDFESESWELADMAFLTVIGQNIPKKNELLGDGDLTWGIGPNFSFPTATEDRLGTERYTAGPTVIGAYMGKKYVLGGLYSQFISYTRTSGRDPVNLSTLQLFYWKNFPGGWQVGGNPIITTNWRADSGDKWNVPIGLGVRKLTFWGKLPVRIGVGFEWSPVYENTYGDRWNIRIDFTPIIPSLIQWPWLD